MNWSKAEWRKADISGTDHCVEVARADDTIGIRDSKNRAGVVLEFSQPEIDAFVRGIKDGEFRHILGH
jgi:hypothetical protein